MLQRTGWRLQLGNRGRVDVRVTVKGEASHSSRPDLGRNAIMGANKAIDRIAKMTFDKTHPLLGGIHAEPYQVVYSPLAPHTLPDTALITVDRRLLPGDDIDAAVDEVRRAIGDLSPFEVTVERGVHMLPALVEANDPGVRAVAGAHKTIHGTEPDPYYHLGAYDAGGPLSHGIPTVQYGLAGATSLLGEDFVPISGVLDEARVLATLSHGLPGVGVADAQDGIDRPRLADVKPLFVVIRVVEDAVPLPPVFDKVDPEHLPLPDLKRHPVACGNDGVEHSLSVHHRSVPPPWY